MSPQERWNRVAFGTLCAGIALVVAAVHGLVEGDDARGVVMTLAPAVLALGLWRFACWRRDR
jgi:hypothetical protein